VNRRKFERKIEIVLEAESSRDGFGITYIASAVALESAVINLEVAILNINSSTLEVGCGPPGIGAEISGNF
jgi:hypothetical protein